MTAVGNLDQILENFSRRLYTLEQSVSSPGNFGGTNEFDEIIIDDGDEVVIITPQPPETPLNVAVTPGSHFDVIYADVEWEAAPTGEVALIYEIEVAEKIAGVYQISQVFRTAGTTFRVQPLEPNTTYGVRVTAMSRIGKFSDPTAWVDFNSGTDNTVPAAITGVSIGRGATSAVVTFTPSAEVDVAGTKGLYEVQIDTVNTFNSVNKKVIRTTSWVVAFDGIQTEANYYARVSAIDSSGNQGTWSATVGPSTVGGVIDNMVVAGLSAAKITFGTMSGDRITANTLDAVAIKTSSITSADITLNGGSFKAGNPPTTGLLINSQGIRLYQSGVQTITLDASTGAATFRGNITGGTIQIGTRFSVDSSGNLTATNAELSGTVTADLFRTNTSGTRVEIDSSQRYQIKFYASDGSKQGSVGTQDGSTNDPMIYESGDGNHYFEKIGGGESRLYVGGLSFYGFLSQTGGTASLRDLDVWSLDSSGDVEGAKGWFTSLDIGSGDMTVSSAGAISGAALQVSGLVEGSAGDFNTLDIGGGDMTVGSSGNISTAGALIVGGLSTTTTAANVNVTSGGTFRQVTSSREVKNVVRSAKKQYDTALVLKLQPRTWFSRLHEDDLGGMDDPNEPQVGFIMEELYEVDPVFTINETIDGEKKAFGVDWNAITAMLVGEVRKLREEVNALKSAA